MRMLAYRGANPCARVWAPGTPPLVFRPPTGMNQVPTPGHAPGAAQGG
jgi:hypothetical protein